MAESEQKNEFLAVMSHELKHPLNLINVNAQLLTTLPEAQTLPAVHARGARRSSARSSGQGRIIDDLLDMSRTQHRQADGQPRAAAARRGDPAGMTWALAEARSKSVRLYCRRPGRAAPDRRRRHPARADRLEPAQQRDQVQPAAAARSTVRLVARGRRGAARGQRQRPRHRSPAFLPHVFQIFRRPTRRPRRDEGGLGIGLALVKSLASCTAAGSRPNRPGGARAPPSASSCRCTRAATSAARPRPSDVSPDEPSPALRVLLVDDTARHARDLQLPARARRLRASRRASSGKEALDAGRQARTSTC